MKETRPDDAFASYSHHLAFSVLRVKAIVFDMDGVLVDSVPLQMEVFRAFFARYDVPFGPEELRRFNGPSTREILQTMKEEHGLPYAVEAAVEERNRIGREYLTQAQPFPRAARIVECFRLRGYRVGLASSAPREVIGQLCGDWPFDAVCSGEDVPRAKPDPDVFLAVATKLGVAPSDCAVVEDSPLGLEAAKRAGMYAVGVTTTVPADELRRADVVVDDLCQTLELPRLAAGEILFQPKSIVSIERVELAVSPSRPQLPTAIAQDVETRWIEARKARTVYNGLLANLIRFEEADGVLRLEASTTDYKTYQGLRGRSDYDIFAHDVCVLGTSGLVVTSDGKVMFARRGPGLVGEGLWHNIPGGLLNIDKSTSPKASLYAELREELGLGEHDIRSCVLVGIGHDLLSKGAELLFTMTTHRTASEVVARQANAVDAHEATNLRAVPLGKLAQVIGEDPMMPASRAIVECFLRHA
jgi:beta-phosphoglucomutase